MTPEEAIKLAYKLSEAAREKKAARSTNELAAVKKMSAPINPSIGHQFKTSQRSQLSSSTLPQTADLAANNKTSAPINSSIGHRLEIGLHRQFSCSILPQIMELASALKAIVLPELEAPRSWPFHDRVLSWLVPSLKADIRKFHEANGKSLREFFSGDGVLHLDQVLSTLLAAQIERRLLEELPSVPNDDE